jgi:hypothetical protein
MFTIVKDRYKTQFAKPGFALSVFFAICIFSISTVINYVAGTYATGAASNSVTDIVLSNIRTFDVDSLFVYGSMFFVALITVILLIHPKRIPFTLYSLALFIVTRSVFIVLTHIAPYPSQAVLDLGTVASKFIFGGDLFFSGHTGMPFLLALIFWDERFLRYLFLTISMCFAAIVLLGHLHYSIDVLSAFFITYTIFHISEVIFKKQRILFFQE